MKVLVINWRDIFHPEAGGAEIHIHELLKRKPNNWQVDFVSATFPGCQPREETPWYTIYRLPNNFLFNFTFQWWWLTQGKKASYDLVIDDISKIPIATPLFIKKVPIVAIMHHIHGRSLYTILPWPLATYVYLMERYMLRAYTNTPLFAVSPSTAAELNELYDFHKLSLAYNGISIRAISFEEKLRYRDKNPLIVYVGRLKSYKRVDHFIQMAANVLKDTPSAQFVIAGQGEELQRLKNLSRDLGCEKSITFAGFISEEEKNDLLKRAWLMVLPSEKEGWGIVVIEANAMATPVVAYDIAGLRDSILNNKTGILSPIQTPQSLTEQVLHLLHNPQTWNTLSQTAIEWAKRFHWDEMAHNFYSRITAMLEEYHGTSA